MVSFSVVWWSVARAVLDLTWVVRTDTCHQVFHTLSIEPLTFIALKNPRFSHFESYLYLSEVGVSS